MKQTLLVILSFLIGLNSFSQNEIQAIKLNDVYSWRNHSQSELNEYYFEIKPIEQSEFKYHFRHQRDGQIVDIYSNDQKKFSGRLINSIIEYKDIKTDYGIESKANNYVFEEIELNKDSVSKIGQLIIRQKLYLIPTDTLIEKWNFGWLDCGGVNFSYKTDKKFRISEYSCLRQQNDSIEYVVAIKLMFDTIGQTLDLQQKYSEFESKLEKGKTYSKNGFLMMYVFTEKQSLAFEKSKQKRDYLKSIKDTIDDYLQTEISKQNITLNGIDCFEDYHLTFAKNGKLEKVKVSDYNKPKLSDGIDFYFEDKREIRKCRKLIKKVFKEIDLSSFNPKYKFCRTLSFRLEGEIQIRDNTIY